MNSLGGRDMNRMKAHLAAGKVCIGATITMNSPVVAELFSHLGFDWLWFETEHSSLSVAEVQAMLQTTNGAHITTIVRVPWNDKTLIKRMLDTGPDGIIIPLVNSAEEAEAAVRAMKYPPWGERGAGLSRAQCYGLHMPEYMKTANDEVLTILMIEHIKAVENIDEILAVKGVDSIMVGALDLSGSMGMLGQTTDPKVEAEIQKVLAACKKVNMPAGIITTSPDQANERIKQGFTNIILGIDVLYMLGGASEALGKVDRDGKE
ncbi:MAG: aldolase/citrate lyase family protein [Nitrospinota bacterium]|nr:aldolase/citrate lyase family protein [Nitrospinota bacterium]